MDLNTAIDNLQRFLSENVVDPIGSRASAWIYRDDTRIDLDKTSYPKILMRLTDRELQKERLGLGNTSTIDTFELEIEIKAKFGEYYGLGDEKYTGEEFVFYISKKIEELIKDSHNDMIDLGFLHVIPIKEGLTKDNDRNPIYTLTLELKYQN